MFNVFVFAIVFVEKRVWQETRKQRGVNGRCWQEQGLAPASLQHVKGFHGFAFFICFIVVCLIAAKKCFFIVQVLIIGSQSAHC